MKIGVGVTTRNRHDIFSVSMDYHHQCQSSDMRYVVVDDASDLRVCVRPGIEVVRHTERKGIAKAKNACLRALRACDYVFLFDDDTFPTHPDWAMRYIHAHEMTGVHHFLHLQPIGKVQKRTSYVMNGVTIDQYTDCGGVMLFLTQKVLERVGGYNEAYDTYGFEHGGYTNRIHRAELTCNLAPYLALPAAPIWAMDWNGVPRGTDIVWRSSVVDDDIPALIAKNMPLYYQECAGPVYHAL